MAEPIGSLRALLSASSAVFESDMKRARNAVRNNSNDMRTSFEKLEDVANKSIKKLFTLRTAAAALAGAGGLYYASRRAIEFADNIGEAAKAAGLTAEEFQSLEYAATQSSVSQEAWSAGIVKFTQVLGDARRGAAAAKGLFSSLGIDDQTLKTSSTSQLMAILADRLKAIDDPARRASIAMDLFGKSGARFGEFLAQGSSEIDKLKKKALDLGIVLSNEVVNGAMRANDELETMDRVLKIGLTNAALQFTPLMRELANIITSPAFIAGLRDFANITAAILKTTRELAPQIAGVTAAFIAMKMGAGKATPQVTALFATLAGAAGYIGAKQLMATSGATEELATATTAAGEAAEGFAGSLDDEAKKLTDTTDALEKKNNSLRQQLSLFNAMVGVDGFAQASSDVDLINDALEKNIDTNTAAGREWLRAAQQNRELNQQFELQKKVIQEATPPIETYRAEVEKLNILYEQGYINQEQYNDALAKARDRFADAQAGMKGLAGSGREMGSAFESAFEKMLTGSESLSDSLRGLARELINIALKKAILEPAGNALSSVLGSVVGNIGGGIGKLFGGGKAVGGPVYSSKAYIVGERGPEMFMPQGAGTIIPNNQLGAMGGNVYQIDARGADPSAVTRLEAALLRLAGPGQVEKRVTDALARGKI